MDRFYLTRYNSAIEIADQLRTIGRHQKVPKLLELGNELHYYCSSTEGRAKGNPPLLATLRNVEPTLKQVIRSVRLPMKRQVLELFVSWIVPYTDATVARFVHRPQLKLKLERVMELTRTTVDRSSATAELFQPRKVILQPAIERFYASESLDEEAAYELAGLFKENVVALCKSFPNDVLANARMDALEEAIEDFETAITLETLL